MPEDTDLWDGNFSCKIAQFLNFVKKGEEDMSLSNMVKVDYGKLISITNLYGQDCTKEDEKKFIGCSGLILYYVSDNYPGKTFFQFYPSDSKAVLTTEIGQLITNRKKDITSLKTRFDRIFVFSGDYILTPDEKWFLRIRAGVE